MKNLFVISMKILLNGGALNLIRPILAVYPHYKDYIGLMWQPNLTNSIKVLQSFGMSVALDNAAYSNFSADKYVQMISKIKSSGCLIDWVSVPDVVGDAQETHTLFSLWQPRLDVPLAYVAQDGCEDLDIPFTEIKCVFIGGTTDWKLSMSAVSVAKESKRQGKIVHIGRVNSDRRLGFAFQLGADSVDGTGYIRFSKERLIPALHHLDGLHRQGYLL